MQNNKILNDEVQEQDKNEPETTSEDNFFCEQLSIRCPRFL